MKRGFTLVELVITLVVATLLSLATFQALSKLLIRSYKAKEETRLSLESQIAIDQIASYLKERIPATTIGYDPGDGSFEAIEDIVIAGKYRIIEWYGRAMDDFLAGRYSGFCDVVASLRAKKIVSPTLSLTGSGYNLVFAGSFDRASPDITDFQNAFGWHGKRSDNSFDVAFESGAMRITDSVQPKRIYEKYYLSKSAYALARGADVNQNAQCIKDLNITKDFNNTLLLFYDYRPWAGQTFCADPKGSGQSGKVAVLAQHIGGFSVRSQDYTLRVILDVNRTIRGSSPLHFSKMKVVW